MKLDNLKPGARVYQKRDGEVFVLDVVEVDTWNGRVRASRNNGPAQWYGEVTVRKWSYTPEHRAPRAKVLA